MPVFVCKVWKVTANICERKVHPGVLIERRCFWLRKSLSHNWLELGNVFWKNWIADEPLIQYTQTWVNKTAAWRETSCEKMECLLLCPEFHGRSTGLDLPLRLLLLQMSWVLSAPCFGVRQTCWVCSQWAPVQDGWRGVLGCAFLWLCEDEELGVGSWVCSWLCCWVTQTVNPGGSGIADEATQKDSPLKFMSGKHWSWQIEETRKQCFFAGQWWSAFH